MLNISRQQMERLDEEALARDKDRLTARLKREHPDRCSVLGETDVRKTSEEAIEIGRSHGLKSEEEVYLLMECIIILGPGFFDDSKLYPEIAAYFNSSTSPADKMERLSDYLALQSRYGHE